MAIAKLPVIFDYCGNKLDIQRKIWKTCLQQAQDNKDWAKNIRDYDRQWLLTACSMSIGSFAEYLTKSVEELAIAKYRYWHHRANFIINLMVVDPSARRDWLKNGGKLDKKKV